MKIWQQALTQKMKLLVSPILKIWLLGSSYIPRMFKASCASCGQEASNNHKRSCTSPTGRLESHQRVFGLKHSFKCRRLTRWIDFFQKRSEEWKSRAQKPADICWGTCLKTSRGVPEVWARLAYVSFLPHNLVTGGLPHTGSRQVGTFFGLLWLALLGCQYLQLQVRDIGSKKKTQGI